jgi:hypothetical protein
LWGEESWTRIGEPGFESCLGISKVIKYVIQRILDTTTVLEDHIRYSLYRTFAA